MRRGRFFGFLLTFFIFFMGFLKGGEFITKNEAFKIAKNYKMIAEDSFFKKWKNINISKLTPFYSLSGDLIGYEISFKKHGNLFISAKSHIPLIPFASEEGYSMSERLEDIYNNFKKKFEKENIKIEDVKYLISLPDCYAIAFKVKGDSSSGLDMEDFKKVGNWFIYSPINECKNVRYVLKIKKSKKRDLQIKNRKLKEIFLDANASLKYKKSLNFKKISFKDKRYIEPKELRDFYQERRNWSNGYCLAGCTPVAWAILLEYWDRHGFPKMVGSAADNYNKDVRDPDVVYMIDKLRTFMNTFCDSEGQGITYREFVQKGIDYVYDRGYVESYIERINVSSIWKTIQYEIGQNRPLLADIDLGANGHSVVIYEFIEDYENLDFKICVKTGWFNIPEKCYDASYINQVHIFIPQGGSSQQQAPIAKIKASKSEIYENETIYLDAAQSYDPDGYITSYVWSMDGKIVGYGERISFRPPKIGKLKIVLTVYDDSGMESRDVFILNVISQHINPTPTPVSRGSMIVSALNGYCIDIAGANTQRGASLIAWPCHGGSNQKWIYEDGMIKSELNGYCIDIAKASTAAGAKLISWPCHGGNNQRWIYENGMIKSRLNGYCIDIAGANTHKGASLISWPCHGGSNQRWYIK